MIILDYFRMTGSLFSSFVERSETKIVERIETKNET